MNNNNIRVIKYEKKYSKETIKIWMKSKEKAINQKDIHSEEENVHFLNNILIKEYQVYLAHDIYKDKIVEIIVLNST